MKSSRPKTTSGSLGLAITSKKPPLNTPSLTPPGTSPCSSRPCSNVKIACTGKASGPNHPCTSPPYFVDAFRSVTAQVRRWRPGQADNPPGQVAYEARPPISMPVNGPSFSMNLCVTWPYTPGVLKVVSFSGEPVTLNTDTE